MKQRIYMDTSVFGGYFDPEFAEFTIPLFERVRKDEVQIIYSSLTEQELIPSPEHVKQLVRDLPAVNLKLGYAILQIRSPRDLMKYED